MQYGVATIRRLLTMIDLFCKIALYRDYFLQKRRTILRSLLIVATPYLCGDPIYCKRSSKGASSDAEMPVHSGGPIWTVSYMFDIEYEILLQGGEDS